MNIKQIIDSLNFRVFHLSDENTEVKGVYASDLLSDVIGRAKESEIWITLQTHQNVAAIASLKDLSAIIIVNSLTPNDDMLEYASNNGINVLGTSLGTFETCGQLHRLLY